MDLGYAWFFIQIYVIVLQVFYPGESQPVFFVASRGHHADIGGITPGSMPPHSKYLHEEGATFKSFKLVDQGVFQEEGWYMINFGSSKWLGLPTSGAFDLFQNYFYYTPANKSLEGHIGITLYICLYIFLVYQTPSRINTNTDETLHSCSIQPEGLQEEDIPRPVQGR